MSLHEPLLLVGLYRSKNSNCLWLMSPLFLLRKERERGGGGGGWREGGEGGREEGRDEGGKHYTGGEKNKEERGYREK